MSDGRLRPPHAASDAALAARLRSGDPDGFGELCARHVWGIHDFLARLVLDAAAAEELTRSVFERAWERRATLRDPERVRAWLYAIAHGMGMHGARARPVDSTEAAAGAHIETAAVGPDEAAVAQEVADLVWASASGLEPRQYAVLDLSLRRGLTIREIAHVLDVPAARARVMVGRARAELGNAVRGLLVAQQRDQCASLAALAPAGIEALAAERRLAVDEHVRRCPVCGRLGGRLNDPSLLLPTLLPRPVPASLEEDLSLLVADARLAAAAERTARAAAPAPAAQRRVHGVAALAVLALLLLAGGAIALLRPAGSAGTGQRVLALPPIVAAEPPPVSPVPVEPAPTGPAVAQIGPSPTPELDASTPASAKPVATVPVIPIPSLPPTVAPVPTAPPSNPTPAPTLAPAPAPTATPPPPLTVAALAVGNQRCEPAGLLQLDVICTFDVSAQVGGATGGEVVTGTLTATSSGSGDVQTATFRMPAAAPGTNTLSVRVSLRYPVCARGVATAATRPASSAPSNSASFDGCTLLGL
jgi:RNA polymerase sigma factor (sigma-70 family)